MWDGREPSLASQATDATLGHAQGDNPPTPEQQQQIVAFESGLFTAQLFDSGAKYLNSTGASGGLEALSNQLSLLFIGINDPFGLNPTEDPFNPNIFDIYDAWGRLVGLGDTTAKREQIARGEEIFNSKAINITGVAGTNDALQPTSVAGFCGTCHDTERRRSFCESTIEYRSCRCRPERTAVAGHFRPGGVYAAMRVGAFGRSELRGNRSGAGAHLR
jgi:cytochrome c peroxidase